MFVEQWGGFLNDVARNHASVVDVHKGLWCKVLAFYLNQQGDSVAGICYEEELQLFKKLIPSDKTGELNRALAKKGVNVK